MGRFGCGAVLELGHFDTGPFWKWAVLTPILVSQYGFHFFTLKLFFFIINITNRNKKQTEGVILFPQLLCKKVCSTFCFHGSIINFISSCITDGSLIQILTRYTLLNFFKKKNPSNRIAVNADSSVRLV